MSHHEVNYPDIDQWFIAYDPNNTSDNSGFAFGFISRFQCMSTGQPNLLRFGTETAMGNRIDQLKNDSGWYERWKEQNQPQ